MNAARNSDADSERIRAAAGALHAAVRPIKVLKAIEWPPDVKQRFFADGACELPRVSYRGFDPAPTLDALREARRRITSDSVIDQWLARQADALEDAARMLAAIGTREFFAYGQRLYGEPTAPLRFHPATPLDLARSMREVTEQLAHLKIDIGPPSLLSADEVARSIGAAVAQHFGDAAPKIEIVEVLSANALASSKAIKLKRGVRFTDRDAQQLLQHEAFVHAATSLNGRAQHDLPILGDGHPYNARTQEGLAVFAELASGTLELDRLTRLADRVFAIQMAVEGADFLVVYRWFLERSDDPDRAFESARRVFRGGVLDGGAPFTKDVVYLYGLLQVINAFRAIFAAGRADCLKLLFCGKLDIADIPALGELAHQGMICAPRFVPPWIGDPRSVYALLAVSSFTSRIDLEPMTTFAEQLLATVPRVEFRP
jgi:uncharacterized protein (TIGR02421 family)